MIAGRLVGVIADGAALARALRLRARPDFFELRLDSLGDILAETERALPLLRAPLIITARHPAEGGSAGLTASARRKLLERFLAHAAFVDVELRSVVEMQPLLAAARRQDVGVILSLHDFVDTPEPRVLRAHLARALRYRPDIFKLATRTDHPAQLERLLAFFRENSARQPLAAVGLGRLGPAARRQLLRMGSVLNYGAVGVANAPGQPTLGNLRRTRAAYTR
jgi:3-dehydroquinate dehydratase I